MLIQKFEVAFHTEISGGRIIVYFDGIQGCRRGFSVMNHCFLMVKYYELFLPI